MLYIALVHEAFRFLIPLKLQKGTQTNHPLSVTSKKSPNVYKSCPKMILLEKLKSLTPEQKLLRM